MAWEIPGFSWTRVAGEDLRDSRFCGVDIERNTGRVILPVQGRRIIGVTRNKADDDQPVTLVSDGVVMARIGITGVRAGDNVTCDDDGTFIQASSGDQIHGVALETNAADDVGTVLLHIAHAVGTGS